MSETMDKTAISRANSTVAVNPLKYKSIKCDKCGNEVFVHGYVFKKIPGLEIGKGLEDQIVPIDVFYCSKCGELMPEYKDATDGAHEDTKEIENKKSNTKLIL